MTEKREAMEGQSAAKVLRTNANTDATNTLANSAGAVAFVNTGV